MSHCRPASGGAQPAAAGAPHGINWCGRRRTVIGRVQHDQPRAAGLHCRSRKVVLPSVVVLVGAAAQVCAACALSGWTLALRYGVGKAALLADRSLVLHAYPESDLWLRPEELVLHFVATYILLILHLFHASEDLIPYP